MLARSLTLASHAPTTTALPSLTQQSFSLSPTLLTSIMAGRFAAAAGAGAGAPAKESKFEQLTKTPAFTVGWNVALFAAGVAFIQSPLMDMLVPQL